MNNIVLFFIGGFIFGFLACFIIFKFKNRSSFEKLFFEFKKSIDELKFQNQTNAFEIKNMLFDTAKLGKILSYNQNTKGKFGEESLENILKCCFNNTDFYKQFVTKNSDNKQIKPDYIVNLPNNKSIVIDCKLNLEKYIEFNEADDDKLKQAKKKELINDINSTVNNLSNKKYITSNDILSPNFIFMYIPLEPLIDLIYTDSDFMSVVKNSCDKNIIIVGASGILTCIRLAREIWANEIQNRNIENIINIAQEIYNLISIHSKNLVLLKDSVEKFQLDFEREFNRFNSNNKLFKTVEKLKDFGIEPVYKKNTKKFEAVEIEKTFLDQ